MATRTYETMVEEYIMEIRAWDWEGLRADAMDNIEEDEEGNGIGRAFLGTVMALTPSGKYYTLWANSSNVTEAEAEAEAEEDEAWYAALDSVAEENGMYVVDGDGDPCDLFLEMMVEATSAIS